MSLLSLHWKKFLLYGLILIVVAIPLYSAFPILEMLGINRININGPQIPFESATWKDRSHIESGDSTRYQMMGDLLKRYEFFGMSREELVNIFGEPDRTNKGTMGYWLASRRSITGSGSVWMVLEMDDEEQKVIGFDVVKD